MKNKQMKISILEKINQSKKQQILFCVILSVIIIGGYLIIDKKVEEKLSHKYTIVNDIKLINNIENLNIENGKISLSGFAFQLEKNSKDSLISVFLLGTSEKNEVWLDVEQSERPYINSYFKSEYNYENSGFHAETKEDKLNADECYEIIIKLNYNDESIDSNGNMIANQVVKTVSSNKYILNGKLYDYNPYEFDEPDMTVKSALLREVFSNGQLCFYQKEAGMYVYQYDDSLYWIATKDFVFSEGESTHMVYHLHTSQLEILPTERIQYGFDNLDFRFESCEYTDEDTIPYRVAIRDIPSDYVITYIRTGHYDDVSKTYIWNKEFQLNNMK